MFVKAFVDWLTNAEKNLSGLKPVSRVLETILGQIEEHKAFQKDVGVHRETMLQLDKKGTHLKYFSQKQDVILIKNLLIRCVITCVTNCRGQLSVFPERSFKPS